MTKTPNGLDRRTTLKAIGLGIAAVPGTVGATASGAPAAGGGGLELAFRAAFGGQPAQLDQMVSDRMAFLADPALVIDADIPFPLDRAGYADHMAFYAANWERLEFVFHDLKTAIHGDTGIVSTYFSQRGKPRNAGFRLRAGYCTAICALDQSQWRAISLHFGALVGQVTDASPS